MYNSPFEYVGWSDVLGVAVEVKVVVEAVVVRQLVSLGVMVVVTLLLAAGHSRLPSCLPGPAECASTNSILGTSLNAIEQTLAHVKPMHNFTRSQSTCRPPSPRP